MTMLYLCSLTTVTGSLGIQAPEQHWNTS